jgi:hypothetical protein
LASSAPLSWKIRHLATAVADRRDDDVGPEARTILAHTPGFFLDAHPGRGLAQQLGWAAALLILPGEESREMQSEHLVRFVALDALGAGVPGEHVAVPVEQINGILADAFDD